METKQTYAVGDKVHGNGLAGHFANRFGQITHDMGNGNWMVYGYGKQQITHESFFTHKVPTQEFERGDEVISKVPSMAGDVVTIIEKDYTEDGLYRVMDSEGDIVRIHRDWMVPVEKGKETEVKNHKFEEGDLAIDGSQFYKEGREERIVRIMGVEGENESAGVLYRVWGEGKNYTLSQSWLTPLEGEYSNDNQQKLLLADLETKKRELLAEMTSKGHQLALIEKTIAGLTKERTVKPV